MTSDIFFGDIFVSYVIFYIDLLQQPKPVSII